MNSKIYRCGWCGHPTDKDDNCLTDKALEKAKKIIEKYGDSHTIQVNGECCPPNQTSESMVQVTRDMASDAGMPEIEGTWINW